ncbi:MAG TPA: 4'-phosphopantetheinyl transferase superfamily protein [Solirubrobacterales bacterium]|nr:4'-phosphopantetheinyl transferase superfamily protein [Solirubrobacterales bacterium]
MIDGVHIWRAALDDPGWPGPEELPPPERERAAAFLREDAARRWVAARWALRRVLARYLEKAPAAVELEVGEHGKPRLRGAVPRFSLSHSAGLALVAVCEREVGIDVEAVRPGRNLVALAGRALPAAEAASVRAAEPAEQAAVFYPAWTRHEARLKCLGAVTSGTSLRSTTSEVADRRLAPEIAVVDLDVPPGYTAAVAVMGSKIGPLRLDALSPKG